MEKTPCSVNPKSRNKPLKTKKKQPLKVVYITNPIKFTATASEFRALVQELTGQDSNISDSSRFPAADGVSGGPKAAEGNAHAPEEQEPKIGQTDLVQNSSYEDDDDAAADFYSREMMENFEGLDSLSMWHQDSNLDAFKRLDASM